MYTMSESRGLVHLRLTPDQQEEIRKATGKLTETLELSIEELEERIAPSRSGRVIANARLVF
jgi:hypothetical protein